MFDGQVKISGTVRELVYDETVRRIYLDLLSRAPSGRGTRPHGAGGGTMKTGLNQSTSSARAEDQSTAVQAMDLLYMPLLDLQQHLKQEAPQ